MGDSTSQHDQSKDGLHNSKKVDDEYSAAKRSRFRMKSKRRSDDRRSDKSRSHRRHRHEDSHRRRRRHRHRTEQPTIGRPGEVSPPLSPGASFRESLFDALADDEGAAHWESVYGQPIHTYERPSVETEQGELEQMTDEEYTAYVRARMWEKTHEGLLEERERRRKAREAENQRSEKQTEREYFDQMVEESLRRGQERQTKKKKENRWTEIWKRYLDSWEDLNARARAAGNSSSETEDKLRNLIVWPVESGKRKDVNPEEVERFIHNAPVSSTTPNTNRSDLLAVLKIERVRWHPDKIQHRYSMLGVEEPILRSATEIFQILDRIWVEGQDKSQGG